MQLVAHLCKQATALLQPFLLVSNDVLNCNIASTLYRELIQYHAFVWIMAEKMGGDDFTDERFVSAAQRDAPVCAKRIVILDSGSFHITTLAIIVLEFCVYFIDFRTCKIQSLIL